jgi:hypothetical protein
MYTIPQSFLSKFSVLQPADYEVVIGRLFNFIGISLLKGGDSEYKYIIQFLEENLCIVDTTDYPELADERLSGNHSLFLDLSGQKNDSESYIALGASTTNYSSVFGHAGLRSGILVSNHLRVQGIKINSLVTEDGIISRSPKSIGKFLTKVVIAGVVTLGVLALTVGTGGAFTLAAAISVSVAAGITAAIASEGMSVGDFTAHVFAAGLTVLSVAYAGTIFGPVTDFFGSQLIASVVMAGGIAAAANYITKDTEDQWFPAVGSIVKKTEEVVTNIVDATTDVINASASVVSYTSFLAKNLPFIALGITGYLIYTNNQVE